MLGNQFSNIQNQQTEAVAGRCSVKKVFLEISQNSQENTCAKFILIKTLAQVFSCEFSVISKNTFPYRTPPVTASEQIQLSFGVPKDKGT